MAEVLPSRIMRYTHGKYNRTSTSASWEEKRAELKGYKSDINFSCKLKTGWEEACLMINGSFAYIHKKSFGFLPKSLVHPEFPHPVVGGSEESLR